MLVGAKVVNPEGAGPEHLALRLAVEEQEVSFEVPPQLEIPKSGQRVFSRLVRLGTPIAWMGVSTATPCYPFGEETGVPGMARSLTGC